MIVRCLLDITLTASVPPNHGRFPVLLDLVFEQLGSEAASWSNQWGIEIGSLQLKRERVAKLLSARNAK